MKPILIDFPESIDSERLIIRAPRIGDGPAVNAAIVESVNELRPWMPWAKETQSVDQTEENIRGAVSRFIAREDLRLQIFLKSDGSFVGGSGLHRIDWDVPRFEIGYWVRTSQTRKGYASEAVRAIAEFAFNTLSARRVEIRMDEKNLASQRVAERAGFPVEAILRAFERDHHGVLRDTRIYARTRPD